MRKVLKIACWSLAALVTASTAACKQTPAPPVIEAALFSFAPGSTPAGLKTSLAQVLDPSTGSSITNASVSMNGTKLVWNGDPGREEYEGSVVVSPGGTAQLTVDLAGETYSVSGTQLASLPSVSAPVSGQIWDVSQAHVVSWTNPVAADLGLIAVLDPANPNAGMAAAQVASVGTSTGGTSYGLSAGSLQVGNELLLVGAATAVPIPRAAATDSVKSLLLMGVFDVIPISVISVEQIRVTPDNQTIPKGTSLQFAATGILSDSSTRDLTGQVTWTSSDFSRAIVSDSGEVIAQGVGTVSISATYNGVTGAASLTVAPPVLVSVASVSPVNPSLPAGVTQPFSAAGLFTDGTVQDITSAVAWSVTGSYATISNVPGSVGVATSVSTGVATVTASSGNTSASTSLTVTDWTARRSGTSNSLWAAASAGTQFVAVGDQGTILTSPDGTSWTQRDAGTTLPIRAVAWSGSLLVAAGGDIGTLSSLVLTSADGISWTRRDAGVAAPLRGVVWAGTQFVAVGGIDEGYPSPTQTILTSPDGISWTSRTAGGGTALNGIGWSGTKMVAVGSAVLTSSDGVSWAQSALTRHQEFAGVAWSGSQFAAVGFGDIFTSPNGADWTSRSLASMPFLPAITWTGVEFVAVGVYGTVLTSPDGVTWTSSGWGPGQFDGPYYYGIGSSATRVVAVGSDGSVLTR